MSLPFIDGIYTIGPARKWFVVYTNPQCEERAERGLRERGFASYLPRSRAWKRQSQRAKHQREPKKVMERPLLTRYLFVALPASQTPFGAVRGVDGVKDFLGDSQGPLPVSGELVSAIRQRESEGMFDRTAQVRKGRKVFTAPKWIEPGKSVHVRSGPFANFLAVIEEVLPGERVKLGVSLFGRHTPVEIGMDEVSAA